MKAPSILFGNRLVVILVLALIYNFPGQKTRISKKIGSGICAELLIHAAPG
jgi:hypothetical protein